MRVPAICPLSAMLCVFAPVAASALGQGPIERTVRALDFSPDGSLLAAGAGDPNKEGTATIWRVASRKPLWEHRDTNGIPAVAFAPDGKSLAIGGYGKTAKLLDVATGKVVMRWEHPGEVRGVAFSPDGKSLATACWDGNVRIFAVGAPAPIATLSSPKDRLFRVQFSPNGQWLISTGHRDGPKLWDVVAAKEKEGVALKHDSFYVPTAAFAGGPWLLTGGYDGTIRLWNIETGTLRATFGGIGGVHALDYSAATGNLIANSSLFKLPLREPTAAEREQINELLARLDDDSIDVREATCEELIKVGFVAEPDLRRATKEAASAEVRIRARQVRQQILNEPRHLHSSHRDIEAARLSPSGALLATGGKDGATRLIEIATGKEIATFIGIDGR